MGANSKIEWCDHTFNPWIGCTKVSPGCLNCYAEGLMDKRLGKVTWGKGNPRVRTSKANWRKVEQWNREAKKAEVRPRVFVASLADWLDPEVPIEWLADLLDLVRRCPNLDFLMLTKRPELFHARLRLVDEEIRGSTLETAFAKTFVRNMLDGWGKVIYSAPEVGRENYWIGTSVEDQKRADDRIPDLLKIPAKVRFLSCEPLLEEVSLVYMRHDNDWDPPMVPEGISWVICGGESGSKARPMDVDWARSLRVQCQAANVPFFMKQMGGTRKPFPEIPEDLMVREFPTVEVG